MHLGTARTALVAWLRARSEGGAFVLRIEDLDAPRVRAGATEAILADLRWLGLDWDEGPDVRGPHAPYVQSERAAIYENALSALRLAGAVYPCTCSRKEIALVASAPHGEEARYPGTCRSGPTHPDRAPAWRFRMDDSPSFVDAVHGDVAGIDGGDFVVQRADGVFAYQLACVVDDRAMGVTEVVRGDDLLSSTPKQIALHRALARSDGLGEAPAWLHVPLVLGADGERLAKRHGAPSIGELRDAGVSAETIVGRLACALHLVDREEPVAARDLIAQFAVAKLPREPTRLPS